MPSIRKVGLCSRADSGSQVRPRLAARLGDPSHERSDRVMERMTRMRMRKTMAASGKNRQVIVTNPTALASAGFVAKYACAASGANISDKSQASR